MKITKKDFNLILVFYFIMGFEAGGIFLNIFYSGKYQKEIQEFRKTKTTECIAKKKNDELEIN